MTGYRGMMSNPEERAREAWWREHQATMARCHILLDELYVAVAAENLPAIERTQETLAEAVEALREARFGPQYPSDDPEDYQEGD